MLEAEDISSDENSVASVQGRQGNVTFRPYRDIKTKSASVGPNNESDDEDVCINNLYPELLCHIFSYLDNPTKGYAAQACKQWRNILNTKEIWRGCVARLQLSSLSTSCVVKSLETRGIKQIQVLTVKKSALHAIIANVPTITHVNLSGCAGISDLILERSVFLPSQLPSLVVVNLSLCKGITDATCELLVTRCPNLEVLDLGGCTGISNVSLAFITNTNDITAGHRLAKLKSLNLRSCWQVSDAGLVHLSSSTALQHLNLQDCQKVSDTALRHLAQGLALVSLNLSFCANISDSGMKSLSKISTLRTLNLRSCDNISDIGVGYLAEGSVGLQSLDLSFCDRVTDRAMVHIASGLFNLTSLSIISCKISDEGIGKLSKTLVDLHVLNIGQCSNITDSGLQHICQRLKRLKFLDLYGCNRISSQGIELLNSECPNLKKINTNLWHSQ